MSTTPWRVLRADRSEYLHIWKVARTTNGVPEIGYLKFAVPRSYRHIGPLLANELVCNRLAQRVGLPVASTSLVTIRGHQGILSLQKVGHTLTWEQAMRRETQPFEVVVRSRRLYKTFVFDAWICNLDRSGKNIIVYRRDGKYDFYLIDHELALLGAIRYENEPWNAEVWDDIVAYTDGYHPALLRYARHYANLAPFVRAMQQIPSTVIQSVIASVPSAILPRTDARLMERMLLYRQRRLQRIVAACARQ